MKYAVDREFANPEAAARKLLDIVRASIAESSLPYAYTGATNSEFLRAGGSISEYTAARNMRLRKNGLRLTDRAPGSCFYLMALSDVLVAPLFRSDHPA